MLIYDSEPVNPETFDPEGKDLRSLVGQCACGKTIRGHEAIPHTDPYETEINDDLTLIVQCSLCEKASNEEV